MVENHRSCFVSRAYWEPVNHLIRLHFARGEEVISEAVRRLGRLAELLK